MGEHASQTHWPAGASIGQLVYAKYGWAEAVSRVGKQDLEFGGGSLPRTLEPSPKKHQASAHVIDGAAGGLGRIWEKCHFQNTYFLAICLCGLLRGWNWKME
jgi:hypothetical protein